MLFRILSIGILFFTFSSCEKDDICSQETPTTPLMFIEFRDANNPNVRKNVSNLKIRSNKFTKDFPIVNNSFLVKLPLDPTENFSEFEFILNYKVANVTENSDKIKINYTRQNEFISKACGYKTNFLLNPNNTLQIDANNNALWLLNTEIVNPTINQDKKEDELHVKIFI